MKRIVLIVPDKIESVMGIRGGTSRSSIEVTADNLLKVLGKRDDYHEDLCFEDMEKIQIVSIEDYVEPSKG